MANLYRIFKELLPQAPLLVGEVVSIHATFCEIALPGGAIVSGRGNAVLGSKVFLRDGVIEGKAPDLTVVTVEI
ncbi:MAG: hypothetical protein K2P84_00035 [Undibacterium sp.]|nr:hypothetical protein [Undibacterium sp.]